MDGETGLAGRLLRLMGEGGIHSTAELARRLGVTEGLVRVMTEDLARRGYLAPVGTACDAGDRTGCIGCALGDACTASGPALTALTPKGWRAHRV